MTIFSIILFNYGECKIMTIDLLTITLDLDKCKIVVRQVYIAYVAAAKPVTKLGCHVKKYFEMLSCTYVTL